MYSCGRPALPAQSFCVLVRASLRRRFPLRAASCHGPPRLTREKKHEATQNITFVVRVAGDRSEAWGSHPNDTDCAELLPTALLSSVTRLFAEALFGELFLQGSLCLRTSGILRHPLWPRSFQPLVGPGRLAQRSVRRGAFCFFAPFAATG